MLLFLLLYHSNILLIYTTILPLTLSLDLCYCYTTHTLHKTMHPLDINHSHTLSSHILLIYTNTIPLAI